MAIVFHEKNQLFHLKGPGMSYLIQLVEGYPVHLYWGRRVRDFDFGPGETETWTYGTKPSPTPRPALLQLRERSSFHPNPVPTRREISLDTLPQEFPQYGTSDLRHPAYQVELEDGTRITELKYESHRIVPGKPDLPGLPATYVEAEAEAETLVLVLQDPHSGLRVRLNYTVFAGRNALARSVVYENTGAAPLRLLRAGSASVDFADAGFDLLCLPGAHERERHIRRQPLAAGSQRLESRRGTSSHQMNPFAALLRPDATETRGEVYGFSLVYSGNFCIEAETDPYSTTRVTLGINDFDFAWDLDPGASFQAPEAILVFSDHGLGGMSRTYHDLYRSRLCRGKFRDQVRPILVNNWEATYFGFTADKIEALAREAAGLGIELLVLDDGWFGHRDNDSGSLGDWTVHRTKLPRGLGDLGRKVNDLGLAFGLWFEPEMVSPDSDLYRAHPDWCLHVAGRRRTLARNQLVLDLSRPEVVDHLFETLSGVLRSAPISYVKWDMNRNFTEVGSAALPARRQKETAHRYTLGLYRLLERIVTAFPDILFESCSGGGGRFDPGMLFYMPQTWTSDDSDAVERLKIQYGTSLVYPLATMGAHVSASPNHQVGRRTSLDIRGDVALGGNFGYELDLTAFTDEDRETVRRQTAEAKALRGLVQQGRFYRLLSPFEGNETAWMVVSDDKKEAVVFYFRTLAQPNPALRRVRLQGLDPALDYRFEGYPTPWGGDLLMHYGWPVPQVPGDFVSFRFRLTAG